MNIANQLTMLRIVLTFVFMSFLFAHGFLAKVLALATFALASLTDMLDGAIAKSLNMITDFGKLMDPIADKILVLAAFISFVEMKLVPAWMVVIIILRETVITGLRLTALNKNKVIPADGSGKHKMVSQVLAIVAILLFLVFKEGGAAGVFNFWNAQVETLFRNTIFVLMAITTILTLVSGIGYLVKNREVYFNEKIS